MSKKNSKQIEEEVQTKQPVQETQVVEAPIKEDAAAQDKIEEEGVQKHEKQEQKKLQNDEIEKVEQSQNKDEEENAMQEEKEEIKNDKQKKENSNQEQFAVVPSNMAQQLYFFGSAECDQYHIEQDEENEGVSEQKRPYIITYFSDKNILIHKIICGGLHTVALSTYGDVYTWGCNDSGALGRLTNTSEEEDQEHPENMQSKPERVPFPGNYKFDMISAGDSHSCCANSKHNILYQWGNFRDTKGEMFKTKALPERIGEKELNRQQIKKIISGANHLFILTDKKLFAWGDPDTSVLGRKPTERHRSEQVMRIESIQNNVEDVWTGAYHGFLKKYRNKKNENGETEKVAMYYGWGLNNHGQLGIDTEEESCIFQTEIETFRGKDIAEIVGGEHHSIALERDGSVYVWGKNDDGQLGIGEEIEEFGIYSEEEIQGFSEEEKKKKTVQIRKPHKIQIENKEEEVMKVKQVLAGTNYCYVFTENIDYQLFSWGMGTNYVLATRGESTKYKPFNLFKDKILMDEDVQQIALSSQHVCYITSESINPPPLDEEKIKFGVPSDFYNSESTKKRLRRGTSSTKKTIESQEEKQEQAVVDKKSQPQSKRGTKSASKQEKEPSPEKSSAKKPQAKKTRSKNSMDLTEIDQSLKKIGKSKK